MAAFERNIKVRFSQTDYAGIIFYPRYYEMLNGVVEDWYEEALGVSFGSLLDDHLLASPLGAIETRFSAPCYLGDILKFRLCVARLGERSVTLDVQTSCNGEHRISSSMTHVCARRDMSGASKWPQHMREKMAQFSTKENS